MVHFCLFYLLQTFLLFLIDILPRIYAYLPWSSSHHLKHLQVIRWSVSSSISIDSHGSCFHLNMYTLHTDYCNAHVIGLLKCHLSPSAAISTQCSCLFERLPSLFLIILQPLWISIYIGFLSSHKIGLKFSQLFTLFTLPTTFDCLWPLTAFLMLVRPFVPQSWASTPGIELMHQSLPYKLWNDLHPTRLSLYFHSAHL